MQSSPETSFASRPGGADMSLVKIIIITLAVILSILFLGRFLF